MHPGMTYSELLGGARASIADRGMLLDLPVGPGKIAYNPCLIRDESGPHLLCRVESRESNWLDATTWDPEIRLFHPAGGNWVSDGGGPVVLQAEDPSATWVHGTDASPDLLALGRVVLDRTTDPPTPGTMLTLTRGVPHLREPLAPPVSIPAMRDVRIAQLRDGRIAVCGRPQGGAAGPGRVSFTIAPSYAAITADLISSAPIIDLGVAIDVKVGSNEIHLLDNSTIGVLGHIATAPQDAEQHYAAVAWRIDVDRRRVSALRVIATRADFGDAPAKEQRLRDVIFPGSLDRHGDGRATLYCGVGDAHVGVVVITDPFT